MVKGKDRTNRDEIIEIVQGYNKLIPWNAYNSIILDVKSVLWKVTLETKNRTYRVLIGGKDRNKNGWDSRDYSKGVALKRL